MTRIFFSSLRVRLLWMVLLAVVPPLGVMLYTAAEWRSHVYNEVQESALQAARHISAIHDGVTEGARHILFGLAQLPRTFWTDQARCQDILVTYVEGNPEFYNVGVVRPTGDILCSARVSGDANNVTAHAHFRRAFATKTFAVGAYEADTSSGRATATFAYPLLDRTGEVNEVLFAVVSLDWSREFSKAVRPDGMTVTIFDERGTVIAQDPDHSTWVGRSAWQAPHVETMLALKDEGTGKGTCPGDVECLFALRRMAAPSAVGHLYVSVSTPISTALAHTDHILARNLVGLGLVVLLAMGAARIGADLFILRRVNVLVNATKRLRLGDLSARTGLSPGPGELNQLATAFDEMAATLEARQRESLNKTEQLARMEQRFRALIEKSSDGIALLDPRGHVVYASPSTTQILGYATEEIVGRDAFDLVHPDDRRPARTRFDEFVGTPRAVHTGEIRVQHQDGSVRWIAAVSSNLLEEPSVRAVVSNYRDITERKRAEEMLRRAHDDLEMRVRERTADLTVANDVLQAEITERRRAEEHVRRLSSAVEQTVDSVFITNSDGIIEYVNAAFETITGFAREEAIGKTRKIISSGKTDQRVHERLWAAIRSGQEFRGVFLNQRKNGELYYEDETITPLRDQNGQITHFVASGRDITRRIRTEEALRRLNDALEREAERIAQALHDEAGQFLTAAHITLAQVRRDLPQSANERLQEVKGHLDHIEGQLRRLAHELRPRILEDLGLVPAIQFLAEGAGRRTGTAITVTASLEGRLPVVMETALYRFVQESLTNMMKHAHAATMTIQLERTHQQIQCLIRDDGVGFDASTVLNQPGRSGLGMVGIRDRVEALGGTLHVNSSPGRGTELVVSIPTET